MSSKDNSLLPIYFARILRFSFEIISEDIDLNSIFLFVIQSINPFLSAGFSLDNGSTNFPAYAFVPNKKFIEIKLFRYEEVNSSSNFDFEKISSYLIKKVHSFNTKNGRMLHLVINNY